MSSSAPIHLKIEASPNQMRLEVPVRNQVNDPRHDQLEMLLSLHVVPGPLALQHRHALFVLLRNGLYCWQTDMVGSLIYFSANFELLLSLL